LHRACKCIMSYVVRRGRGRQLQLLCAVHVPEVKEYLAFLSRYVPSVTPDDGFAPDTYNWSQHLVRVLQQCGDDLSRENVMRQATNIRNFIPTMLLPGLSINIGPKDYAPIKQVQLTKFEGERWMPLGDPVEGN
jgi:branched-chain amino acid transport system substrate-binding protein